MEAPIRSDLTPDTLEMPGTTPWVHGAASAVFRFLPGVTMTSPRIRIDAPEPNA